MSKLNKFKAVAIAIVMAISVAIPIAIAQSTDEGASARREHRGHRGDRGRRGGDRMMGRLFEQLDLTDAQKAQINTIRENSRQTLRPLMEELRAKRKEIRESSKSGQSSETIEQKRAELAPLHTKLREEQTRIRQEMFSVLTAEQKAKLEQLREQYKSKWGERRARKQQATL